MNIWDVVILLAVAVMMGLAVHTLRKGKAGSCHSCGGCSQCNGGEACRNCQQKNTDTSDEKTTC